LASPTASSPSSLTKSSGTSPLARIVAVVLVVVAIVVVAILLFAGGSGGYTVYATFQNASQLVKGNQVEVGGRPIGTINDIELTKDGRARVKMTLDDYAPLHVGTTATIRANSLSGIAGRYISLQLGPNSADKIPEGGEIRADNATSAVDLDQLFNTLDDKTRRGLQNFVQGSARQIDGKVPEAQESLTYLSPALATSSALTREIVGDQITFKRFVADASQTVAAIAERKGDLTDLVTNANQTAAAIGDENQALSHALAILPDTLRNANTTFVNLRSALVDLTVLTDESKPATKNLAEFFRQLRPLVREANPTVRDLSQLISSPGPGNDLIDLNKQAPKLDDLAKVVFPRSIEALKKAQPVISYIRPYGPDLIGWITKFGQGAANYDANGHYARISPLFNSFQETEIPGLGPVLSPTSPQSRLAGVQFGKSQRCPGGATQPAPDGSNPWRDTSGTLDCDPTTVPPGP
jgi:phospholipid/cholesterol/gamma-HCH transport system substrate-binding protein